MAARWGRPGKAHSHHRRTALGLGFPVAIHRRSHPPRDPSDCRCRQSHPPRDRSDCRLRRPRYHCLHYGDGRHHLTLLADYPRNGHLQKNYLENQMAAARLEVANLLVGSARPAEPLRWCHTTPRSLGWAQGLVQGPASGLQNLTPTER